MTAPTPDLDAIRDRYSRSTDMTADKSDREFWELAAESSDDVPALLNALTAVTAERDQVVCELAEQKRINASNLRAMVIEADQVQGQLDQARQMLADAPHGDFCNQPEQPCRCWKAGL